MVVLMVSGVLLVSALAAAFLGTGFGDETPHGRLLTTLEAVAGAQEGHYRERGRFIGPRERLPIEAPSDVELHIESGTVDQWRAVATAPEVELTCLQAGGVANGEVVREPPICYREAR
jgi:hypothetical protein